MAKIRNTTELEEGSQMIRVSKLFLKVIEMQRKKVDDVTYGCVKGTNSEITEILAKKLINAKLV